jgi:uncharacterized protein (DUF433 family)
MTRLVSTNAKEPWLRRLTLPAYHIKEAARYAHVSPKTVSDWFKLRPDGSRMLAEKADGLALSYFELIEVAAIAALRKAGLSLHAIYSYREYVAKNLAAEFPFAQYKFKTDGQRITMNYEQIAGPKVKGTLIEPGKGGQLGWCAVLDDKLKEFDYSHGVASRWHVAGKNVPIVIDPQIAFGAPVLKGVPTWVLRERYEAGESLADIADDFGIKESDVKHALSFEGLTVSIH